MRLLFSVNNFGFLRNFEPALRLLAARGHHLHLVADRRDSVGGMRTIENLVREYPDRITYGEGPSRKDAFWQPLAVRVRLCLDHWRYLDTRYDRSPSLRARAARQAPAFASRLPRIPLLGSAPAMRIWRRVFHAIERAIPAGESVERFLRDQQADLLLLTPLLYFGSQQVEYVRAAKALGIRTVLGVGSWDHLTTKGLIHERPDRVIVWNEFQRQEAAALHGIPSDSIIVTGAQAYDQWFTATASTTREQFCAKVGVPSDRPLLLYLCSSPFITPYEVGFVRRWIDAVRGSSDPELRRASILIRPHPQNARQWRDVETGRYEAVGIWPRAGANPVDAEARADYYDSMFHSIAVVGINTSALIESGIVGRPVYTVLTEEFAGQQEGTLHFQHLKNVNGGLLHVGASMDEHLAHLASAVRGGHDAAKSRAFVEAFIRPHGVDSPAADAFVRAIEAEAAAPRPAPLRASPSVRLRRMLLAPAAAVARTNAGRRKAPRREEQEGADTQRLRLLFVLASPEFLRYYDSTMTLLADRGHQVMVGVNWLRERKHARLEHLVDDRCIDVIGLVPPRDDVWLPFARALRGTMDFVRYLHPRFADAPVLRARMYRKVLPRPLRPLNRVRSLSADAVTRLLRALQAIERAIPVSRQQRQLLEAHRPDALVVSPLVDAASDQVDTARAAHAAGIPVVAAVASWDNLTNKGHMRVAPDMVTVWNEHQRTEASTLHHVSAERVVVTGAQLFDRWFEREPSRAREAFCAIVGLPDTRPFVLFTGSSVFISRSEVEVPFVRRWVEALRASEDPVLRAAAVLVRPHPFNCDAWTDADFSDLGPVAIWPRRRYTPADESARTSFFDSLFHSAAVVGINTSAMIEAAILRKPVLSLLTPDFAGTQEGTLHFQYLLPENGGFLRVAHSFEDHIVQLGDVLRHPDATREQTDRFVRTFIRPQGLSQPCTPILVDALERGAAIRRMPVRDTITARMLRALLWPIAVLTYLVDALQQAQVWRRLVERWSKMNRRRQIVVKRLVIRPVRVASSAMVHAYRLLRRAARFLVRWTLLIPGRKAVRAARLARYHLAVKIRGEALSGEGGDGRT